MDYVDFLIKNKQSFILKSTANYAELTYKEKQYIILQPKTDKQFFPLYSKVKSDVTKYMINKGEIKNIQPKDVRFINWDFGHEFKEGEVMDVWKLDIKAAYWNTAYNYGYISKNTYDYGIKNKSLRLAALGALASKKEIHTYNKGVLKSTVIERPIISSIYFEICQIVDDIMQNLATHVTGMLGYYVDCLFINSKNQILINQIKRIFNKNGYDVTSERDTVSVKRQGDCVYLMSSQKKQYFVKKVI